MADATTKLSVMAKICLDLTKERKAPKQVQDRKSQ
eukprot:CAMPEP_0183320256 /NCGR_PEP_ID=MMETSP0160_2-20130417/65814_1 /TAXON_ID=2839 ORGANISM="Odontella Sinensis, Strain Grunow 1884" /NCGR_SAMPLE_ID=MMETSP0160_2 /ASSEMBLY_ACC=CAM_ASM_000250 /LENGTH=34 /DNA_ID= /DNA_START= /DNA_END= /DNA_ORIENTATION=